MDISIIIVNYNTALITEKCVNAILRQQGVEFEIIVIDNDSRDNSLEILRPYQDKFTLIENKDNRGFAKAANQAFAKATGRYYYNINPDAFLEKEDDLKQIVDFMDNHPEYGVIGPKVLQQDGFPEQTVYTTYPGEYLIKNTFNQLPGEIAWVYGASVIFRQEVFKQINGFDEDYFVYAEDTDICLRARKAGYTIGYLDNVVVGHIGRASESSTPQYVYRMRRQKALHTFYKKHYTSEQARQIVNYELKQAMRSFLVHKLKRLFYKSKRLEKHYEKNRAVIESSRAFLES